MSKIDRFEVADRLGVTTRTLRRWNNQGRLVPFRDATNHPYYTTNQIENFLMKGHKIKHRIIWTSKHLNKTKLGTLLSKYSKEYLLLQSSNTSLGEDIQLSRIITYALDYQLGELIICKDQLINQQAFEILRIFLKRFNVKVTSID